MELCVQTRYIQIVLKYIISVIFILKVNFNDFPFLLIPDHLGHAKHYLKIVLAKILNKNKLTLNLQETYYILL